LGFGGLVGFIADEFTPRHDVLDAAAGQHIGEAVPVDAPDFFPSALSLDDVA